jgi:sialic acid synthase SpsE
VEEDFVIKVAKEKKPVILRVGGASLPEIKRAIYLIKKYNKKEITLLHGIQSYPTKIEDTNLNLISALIKTFKLPVGIADHMNAESEMAYVIPLMAIPMGAILIEKHLTHNRALKGVDYVAAFNPDEFKKFVGYIKEAEKALGISYFKKLSKAEEKYRKVVRKRTVAVKDIKAGKKITKNNITFKRADEGLYPDEIKKFFGKKPKYNIKRDEPILKNKLK